MQITWLGLGSFVFTTKVAEHEVVVVTDPYQNDAGLRFPRTLTAAMVVRSHEGPLTDNVEPIVGEGREKPFVISHAGEYEVQGVFVTGVAAPRKDGTPHTIYRIVAEDLSIAFLGALDRDLTDAEIEDLGNIDVLIVPVGGGTVLSKDVAVALVARIEPRLVIPSYYDSPELSLADVEPFCKELACPREDVTKLKITKSALPQDEIQTKVLHRS